MGAIGVQRGREAAMLGPQLNVCADCRQMVLQVKSLRSVSVIKITDLLISGDPSPRHRQEAEDGQVSLPPPTTSSYAKLGGWTLIPSADGLRAQPGGEKQQSENPSLAMSRQCPAAKMTHIGTISHL